MRQWDVFMFPFSKERRHPAVIISNDETCQNPDIEEVNALLCASGDESHAGAMKTKVGQVQLVILLEKPPPHF